MFSAQCSDSSFKFLGTMENTSVRIRLVFEDRHILSKSKKLQGLNRCWFLLLPSRHQSISDLSDHILHKFDLLHSCPHGVLLTMDGFVLPPFESTSILKEKDIVCVKKGGTSSQILKVGDTGNLIEEIEAVEKQPLGAGMLLLANEEFEKEIGGYQSEPEEEDMLWEENSDANAVSKKRKAPKKLQKKKKPCLAAGEVVENDVFKKQKKSCNEKIHPRKNRSKKNVLNVQNRSDIKSTKESAEKSEENIESTPNMGSSQLEEDDNRVGNVPEGTKKVPSRSARRIKSKRRWLREMAKIQKNDIVQSSKRLTNGNHKLACIAKKDVSDHPKGLLHWKQLPEKDIHKKVEGDQVNQTTGAEDKFVPYEDRPGHIRFEPLEDQAAEQHQPSMQTFLWNGITCKKKGQKWGKDNSSASWRNNQKELTTEHVETSTINRGILVNPSIDFDKSPPLTSFPQEGDLIAYRLLELSSSWTPELSSFQVGKVTWYKPECSKVLLTSVPEYPIVTKKQDEDESSVPQPDNSLYREDGSLEIDFSSLVDTRLVKRGGADPTKLATGLGDDGPMANKKDVTGTLPHPKDNKQKPASTQENGQVNLWEQFSEALNAKKADLSQENGRNLGSSGWSSWSHRALRCSALGPTMAILRSKNQI